MRYRTLIGCLLILVFLVVWIAVAVVVADHLPKNRLVQFVYFAVAGIGWGLPVIPLMNWMGKDK